MYSYSYRISLDGVTRTITLMTDGYLEEEGLKLDAFVNLYEKEMNELLEWESIQNNEQMEEGEEAYEEWHPRHYSQLCGKTLEAFNRMEFELLDLSKLGHPKSKSKSKVKKKSFWNL